MLYRADRTLYWDASKAQILEADNPDQAYLCIHEGAEVDDAWLEQRGCQFDTENQVILTPDQIEAEKAAKAEAKPKKEDKK